VLIFVQKEKGAWIIGSGMLFFAFGILHRVSINVELLDGDPVAGGIFGSGLFILSMSVFSYSDFARTQKRLGDKLQEVKVLSEKAIEQEKLNKEIEIESKLLEVEHNRKTRELEEARALQLSMLPRKMPDLPHLEVAVWMETATEVGGDYYDYHLGSDGTVTFVLGDATGHGLKAGIMVATAKSYFHTLAGDFDNLTILKKMSSGFRNLDLKLMFMGILLARTNGDKTIITSAGMPPILWYRKDKKTMNRLVQKGLPLGTKIDFNYRCKEIHTSPGDLLLLMSDGLMELFDENRQQLGIDKIEQVLDSSSDLSPSDIINQFKLLTAQWAGNSGNDDDITLMVIKVKDN
jgi:serine phosphatase RsbU (regulator of sigma subunit)